MNVRAHFAILCVACVISACIFVVPSSDVGGVHCAFSGAESDCGRCLAQRCGAEVDACCLDDSCGGVISDVETCATKTDESCVRVASASDRGGAHSQLSKCVATGCATACQFDPDALGGPSNNLTRCKRSYVTSVEACECEIGPTPNDFPCTEIGHPNLLCCAPDDWPTTVRTCDCLRIICVPITTGCHCQLSAIDDQDRATECTGDICCKDPMYGSCDCGPAPCAPGQEKVSSCTLAALSCGSGLHRITACSVANDGG